jgi:hypothetical protein
MRAPTSALALFGSMVLAATLVWAQAGKDRRFFSARAGVGIEAPSGWALSTHTGYPTVLVALIHPGGSRISLAVDRTKLPTAAALAEDNRKGLLAQGLTIERTIPGPRGGVEVDARAARRNQVVRQLYVIRELPGAREPRQAIVVSLTAPADQLSAVEPAFAWALGHLTLEEPVQLEAKPDGGR